MDSSILVGTAVTKENQSKMAEVMRHYWYKLDGTRRTLAERKAMVAHGVDVAAAKKVQAMLNHGNTA